mgnify:CR=1 FL=1
MADAQPPPQSPLGNAPPTSDQHHHSSSQQHGFQQHQQQHQQRNYQQLPAVRDLRGRVALVTGATSGLGLEAAAALAARGATVLFGARNPDKAARVAVDIRAR